MNPELILNYTIPERIRRILDEHNVDYIYVFLTRIFSKSLKELKSIYDIKMNVVLQSFEVRGNIHDIAKLFYQLTTRGVQFESVSELYLRISIPQFISRIR